MFTCWTRWQWFVWTSLQSGGNMSQKRHSRTVRVSEESFPRRHQLQRYFTHQYVMYARVQKARGFPYSLLSVGSGADPGSQPIDDYKSVIHPAVGCHYFPPGLRLPSQPHSITAPWPAPTYTARWQRHIGVNNLPKVVTQQHSTRCATTPPSASVTLYK